MPRVLIAKPRSSTRHFILYLLAWLPMTVPLRAEDGLLYHVETAQNIAQNDHRLILVDFWASWCGPCLKMDAKVWSDPAVQEQKAKFVPLKIDVDRYPTLASRYQINAMPTLMVLDSYGDILYRHKGYMDKHAVNDLLSSFPFSLVSINQLHQQISDNSQNLTSSLC